MTKESSPNYEGKEKRIPASVKVDIPPEVASAVSKMPGKQASQAEIADILDATGSKGGIRPTKNELEARRQQVLKLTLRGIGKQIIANYLEVSVKTVYRDLRAAHADLKAEVSQMDFPTFVGMTINFYDDVRGSAMRIASESKSKIGGPRLQLSALSTALAAENAKHVFLERSGLYGLINPKQTFPTAQGEAVVHDDEHDFQQFLEAIDITGELKDKILADGKEVADNAIASDELEVTENTDDVS